MLLYCLHDPSCMVPNCQATTWLHEVLAQALCTYSLHGAEQAGIANAAHAMQAAGSIIWPIVAMNLWVSAAGDQLGSSWCLPMCYSRCKAHCRLLQCAAAAAHLRTRS